jgi:hypothetical protein
VGAEAKAAAEKKASQEKLAALTPPAEKSDQPKAIDLPRSLQAELRRVGCNTGAVDGNWNAASQRSLDLFNKHAGLKLDAKVASVDALDVVKSKTTRVCPLVCDHGFKADGDRCTKITCRAGYEVGDENTCEKIEMKKPTAKREEPRVQRDKPERGKLESTPSKPQAAGQIFCSSQGCRTVGKGCSIRRAQAPADRSKSATERLTKCAVFGWVCRFGSFFDARFAKHLFDGRAYFPGWPARAG